MPKDALTTDDFVYYAPTRRFIFIPTGQRWVKAGVDAALPPIDNLPASAWIVQNRSVCHLPRTNASVTA